MAAVAAPHLYHAGPSTSHASPSAAGYGGDHIYQTHSVMEDATDEESEDDFESEVDPEQQRFYAQQQQQALYYQQHQQQNGGSLPDGNGIKSGTGSRAKAGSRNSRIGDDMEDDDMDSDDESSMDSIPYEIDPSLTYALHTFLATVEGQASVVKGDSLLLLDDTNAYWWLVRVLKTEDVGYIPAENIETPYERLARLNKHRNVDLAHPTSREKELGEAQGREKLKAGMLSGRMNGRKGSAGSGDGPRRVIFAPPTYVEPSIRTWSSDEEDGSGDDEGSEDDDADEEDVAEEQGASVRMVQDQAQTGLAEMEPDDGVEWADGVARDEQRRATERKQAQAQVAGPAAGDVQAVQPKSNNPFAPRRPESSNVTETRNGLDPAQAGGETRRITVTPAVAQETPSEGILLPSAVMANAQRTVSGQSSHSMTSINSNGSIAASVEASSPQDDKKARKMRKSTSQDSLNGSDKGDKKEKKRSMLGGLFSRKSKDKKGISSSDPRNSEDSVVSGQADGSPSSMTRKSEDSLTTVRAPTPADVKSQHSPQGAVPHSFRLQQQDQATMQAYSNKYLKGSPTTDVRTPTASEAAAAVAQSAAAMRLAASINGATNRPSSIIVSPNPAAPLLNVMRIFAGEHVKSDASFKTVLLNDTTTSVDLIRQVMQRFRIHHSSQPGFEAGFYLTIKDVNGEEMELGPEERPLTAFLDAIQRCAEEDGPTQARAMTPTVKRSSVSSISSVMSLSSHPAIAKLGMNDFSDDSVVKIYLNRRRPASGMLGARSLHDSSSELGSHSSQLSTVLESSPRDRQSGVWSNEGNRLEAQATAASPDLPSQPSMRYNPSLTINTKGEASPERFSSPSSRFTVQLLVHPSDLPDTSVFDPVNDVIISRQVLRDRQAAGHPSQGSRDLPQDKRRRLFMLPRNATVVEAIEQGLDRFGIQEGVVDGGDDVEDRAGKRSGVKIRYSLTALINGQERSLAPSSKVLDAYSVLPTLKPVERTTPEQRRRSREWSYNQGNLGDILPSDPTFVLRRSGPSQLSRSAPDNTRSVLQQQQQQHAGSAFTPPATQSDGRQGAMSPQEIIAAQRAASRANQKALISAQTNKSEGIDVVLADKGTLRSSRLLEPTGDAVVRYSFIDHDGETYDISELLKEEWGNDGSKGSPAITQGDDSLRPPAPLRQATDQSLYVTAPSTPEPGASRPIAGSARLDRRGSGSTDILRGVVERSAGKPEGKLEEKIARVIDMVKSGKGSAPSVVTAGESGSNDPSATSTSARSAPAASTRPLSRAIVPLSENHSATSSPSSQAGPRSNSRQGGSLASTAQSVNRIISRHRQQPSIASIMSDISAPVPHDRSDDGSGSASGSRSQSSHTQTYKPAHSGAPSTTPATAAAQSLASSSANPNLSSPSPLGGAMFVRPVNTVNPKPIPRTPMKYTDDFGVKALLAIVEARAQRMRPPPLSTNKTASPLISTAVKSGSGAKSQPRSPAESDKHDAGSPEEQDEALKPLFGERFGKEELDRMDPGLRACFTVIQTRLDAWDNEIDDLLIKLGGIRT